jgi:hypothetical protein
MKRSDFCCISSASVIAASSLQAPAKADEPNLPAAIAGIKIPDSYAAKQAATQAQDVEAPEIFRHSARSFVFAELVSQARGMKHDPEIVYIAAMLHDIGLSKEFATPHARFEIDGADRTKQVLTAAGHSAADAQIGWDAVALHSIFSIAGFKEPEVFLLSAGVLTDVGGAFLQYLDKAAVAQVLAALPRRGFNKAFLTALTDYARRKPDTVGGTFVEDIAAHTIPGYKRGDFYEALLEPDQF